jgi:hypothetical protein
LHKQLSFFTVSEQINKQAKRRQKMAKWHLSSKFSCLGHWQLLEGQENREKSHDWLDLCLF